MLLAAYVRRVAEAAGGPLVLACQGGEPTLAGLSFYRRAVAIACKVASGRELRLSLPTNGLLLADDWCGFLAEHRVLVGLSLDGPSSAHHAFRRR
ncbi:MAG: hypothetical protein N2652_12615 [Kiritimatiellae bacterium]|nr:hypothetical protein [Kiritimatiellia bacterium]